MDPGCGNVGSVIYMFYFVWGTGREPLIVLHDAFSKRLCLVSWRHKALGKSTKGLIVTGKRSLPPASAESLALVSYTYLDVQSGRNANQTRFQSDSSYPLTVSRHCSSACLLPQSSLFVTRCFYAVLLQLFTSKMTLRA